MPTSEFDQETAILLHVTDHAGRRHTLAAIEESFMNSAGHRANILGTRWTHVASGVARGDCVTSSGFVIKNAYFVAQVFVQL